MIIEHDKLKYRPYIDKRGIIGTSGQLYIAENNDGMSYIVKSSPVDVLNEYVAHSVAKAIGVPTSEVVLIRNGKIVDVGIRYETDFERISMDDLIGGDNTKYPDDSPYVADVMKYLAFRQLISLEDNPQLAVSDGRVISFDYAESFSMTEYILNLMINVEDISAGMRSFLFSLVTTDNYNKSLEIIKRPDIPVLHDAFYGTIKEFKKADFMPIINELDEIFPPVVSVFYEMCFVETRKRLS